MNPSAHSQADDQPNPANPTNEIRFGTASQSHTERRRKQRALISCPIRVRGFHSTAEVSDEISTTTDVSRNGILFLTSNQNFHRGMEVAVTMPYTESAVAQHSEQPGSIVRVSALSTGRVAIAIAFGLSALPRRETTPAAANLVNDRAEDHKSTKQLILLVDADLSTRESLKAYLSAQGYRVIAIRDASEGRDVLNAVTPALVIAEIEGEGLPGFDLCVHIKATPRLKHIPVMLTTKSAYPTDYSNAHSLGAVVCVAKPYRQERIGHVVRLLVPPAQTDTKQGPPLQANRVSGTDTKGHSKKSPQR
jgi:CheY-like chemotaxis protein